jgi:hypothetical protein
MTNSERFVQAHKNTRKAVQENSSLNYRVQFGLELAELYSKKEISFDEKLDYVNKSNKVNMGDDKYLEANWTIEDLEDLYKDGSIYADEMIKLEEAVDYLYELYTTKF